MSETTNNHKVPAVNFIGTMMANLDNENLSDAQFRDFIRTTIPIVEKPAFKSIANEDVKKRTKKYYKNEEI